jgi:hypothetical protein
LLPSSNAFAIVLLVSFVESFVSPEVLSLIIAVSDPLLAFVFEKKGREGSGWRGTARWDRPGRSDGCLWRRIRRLWTRYHVGGIAFIGLWWWICGALGFILRGVWIASRDGVIGPFEELPRCQLLFTTVAVSGILLVVICTWGREKVIATI